MIYTKLGGVDPAGVDLVGAVAREKLAHPERFELPTTWFVARYSIQLSYGCEGGYYREGRGSGQENRSCSAVVRRFRRTR